MICGIFEAVDGLAVLLGLGDNESLKYFYDIYVCVHGSVHVPWYIVGARGQLTGVGSFFLSCGFRGLNSGHHVSRQAPFYLLSSLAQQSGS